MLYIFIFAVMHFLWATFLNIQLHAETGPAKLHAPIQISQLMPYLHRMAGHAIVMLFIMKG